MSGTLQIEENKADISAEAPLTELSGSREDYSHVRHILMHLAQNPREQFTPESIASHIGLSQLELEQLFQRWAGLSAEEFLKAIGLEHARNMLQGSASLLELADVLGVSGPARLHDLIISHKTMTNDAAKKQSGGLQITYGFHPCPFGIAIILMTNEGVCGMGFCDETREQTAMLEDMKRWPDASYIQDQEKTARVVSHVFSSQSETTEKPINIVLIGTDFEIKVWEALLKVPVGRAVTYTDLAEHIGNPGAHRAVGSAVGRNPISLIAPCHRVLRKDAALGGYHWGVTRKQAIIGWEAGKLKAELED